ncbi:hypothetical protein EMIHUDRAFT_422938 [Emiliania huxleyi CCMP1516]|uniref:Peroxisomal membrane protein n=2 Tax=Emiliania huxleyi TaxID=2903 RepID=A0A0D3KXM0_EMIH1|nr:hypothetical protein EMIHUDRAFT_422938 [Emiliania huxleyi CCMP1516]EOD40505.1 hypothetical protein EMIHUDRAFT_422938 [Emiliania huxleyi CCMP1516]|eukprot:XP_005792934.1 hypothetical protein EMIHUDRAFT_422938 [Emiliania huxleyi CCMP1516]
MSAIGLIALLACPSRVELHAHRPTPVRHRSRRPVAIAIQGDVVMSAADTILRRAPYASAFAVVGVKAVLADLLAQTRERRLQPVGARVVTCDDLSCEEIEVAAPYCARRTLAFLLYGGIYQGCFQHWLFNRMLPALVGEGSDLRTVLSKVAVDQLILTPFLCLPAAYLFKALAFGYGARLALRRYLADARRDLLAKYWALWTPVQCLTFGVVPPQWRIAFVAAVSFFWLIVLSSITARSDPPPLD